MPPRKSVRIAELSSAAIASAQARKQAALTSEHFTRIETPPRKKRKVTVMKPSLPTEDDFRKIRGKRGALKAITEMPVDLLLEIFSQLQPVDLLHVSRATKALRAIVLEENLKSLWARVFENIPPTEKPPSCPPGLSPIHYANLLYGRHCHFCAAPTGRIIHWSARVRFCSKCAPRQLILNAKTGDMHTMCSGFYFKSSSTMYSGIYVFKTQYHQHALRYNKIQTEEAKVQYKEEAEKEVKIRSKQGHLLRSWERKVKNARAGENRSARDRRRRAIIQMIHKEGYGPELSRCRVENLPYVKLTRVLTDEEWKKIRHRILLVLEYVRQENTRKLLISNYNVRLRILATKVKSTMSQVMKPPVFPPISQYARAEPFCRLIKDEAISSAKLPHLLEEYVGQIPELAALWRVEAATFLRDLLRTSNFTRQSDVDPLQLAVTFFKCQFCNDPISYPRILMHRCVRDRLLAKGEENVEGIDEEDNASEDNIDEDEETSTNDDTEEVVSATPDSVWSNMSSWYGSSWNENNDQIFVDEEAIGFARVIVKACKEDPDSVTFSAMDEKDARLECVRCTAQAKRKVCSRLVMNWKMAILHDVNVHFEQMPSEQGWKLLTEQSDLAKVKESELKMMIKWKQPDYHCAYCQQEMPRDNFELHFSVFHPEIQRKAGQDQNWIENHIYAMLDVSMKTPPYPVKI